MLSASLNKTFPSFKIKITPSGLYIRPQERKKNPTGYERKIIGALRSIALGGDNIRLIHTILMDMFNWNYFREYIKLRIEYAIMQHTTYSYMDSELMFTYLEVSE